MKHILTNVYISCQIILTFAFKFCSQSNPKPLNQREFYKQELAASCVDLRY